MKADQTYYLSSHDYVSTPLPRTCSLISVGVVSDTQQVIYYVKIFPELPGHVARLSGVISKLFLGEVCNSYAFVDIYVQKKEFKSDLIQSADLIKIGLGQLSKTYKEALNLSPIDKH
jgi:hypothetical protein